MSSMTTKQQAGLPSLVNANIEVGSVGTVAALGSTNSDAAPLPFDSNQVTGADAAKGVILLDVPNGSSIRVFNNAAAVLKVYPPSGGQINNLTATSGNISIAANKGAVLCKLADGQWGSIHA